MFMGYLLCIGREAFPEFVRPAWVRAGRVTLASVLQAPAAAAPNRLGAGAMAGAMAWAMTGAIAGAIGGGGFAAEEAVEVVLGYGAVITTLLKKKAGQGRLHQPVLIPLGMARNEIAHSQI